MSERVLKIPTKRGTVIFVVNLTADQLSHHRINSMGTG